MRWRITTWGRRWNRKGRLMRQLQEFQEAAKLDPGNADAQKQLGTLLQRSGNGDGAVAAFRRVAKLRPESPDAHNDLGLALLQIGDAQSSIREFRGSAETETQRRRLYRQFGRRLFAEDGF